MVIVIFKCFSRAPKKLKKKVRNSTVFELDFPISRYYRNSENDSRNTKVNDSVAIVYDISMGFEVVI